MKEYKRLWMILGLIMVGSFTLLGYFGKEVYNERPPIPAEFVDESGKTIYTEADILAGQSAWQSIGGMSVGTVWGHGAYQAPDWTADWIHREVLGWLDQQAQREFGKPYDQLSERDQATLHYDAQQAFRKNTYDHPFCRPRPLYRRCCRLLRQTVRQRPGAAQAARSLCDERRHPA